MRTTLLGSLLDVARRNLAHDAQRVALFESGRVYLPGGGTEDGPLAGNFPGEQAAPFFEPHRLACLAVGPVSAKGWRGGGEPADFFALKGVLEALADRLGATLEFEAAAEPYLHPGRAARVLVAGADAGWIGEIHPLVCRQWDLQEAVGFEVGLAVLLSAATAGDETFADLTTFPGVLQDLAVVVPRHVSAAAVREAVVAGGGELLRTGRGLRPLRRRAAGGGA